VHSTASFSILTIKINFKIINEKMFNLLSLKTTFEDVYGSDYSPQEYTGTEYTERIDVSGNESVYVHECVFRDITNNAYGGALYCSDIVQRLLIEQSSFISCITSENYGGGIYSRSEQCVLSRICAFNCCSTYNNGISRGQFAYINSNIKNNVNDSSITHTLKRGTYPWYALCLDYGNILCTSVNLTNNECYRYPALLCYRTSSISYSSIVNNTANPGYGCIVLSYNSHCIDTCNILNNYQGSNDYEGTIYSSGNLFIKDSCILGNNRRVFYAYSSGKITISNCTIDDDIFTNNRFYGTVTVNKTIERTFINALSHIATQRCDSYFDSYGTLTVNPCLLCKCSHTLMSCNCNYNFRDFYYYKLHRAFILN